MKKIILADGNKIPVLCYGSSIINYNFENKIKLSYGIIKKILKGNVKEVKKDFSILKIMNEMLKYNLSAIDTSRAYGISENLIGLKAKKNRDKFYIITKVSNYDQYQGKVYDGVRDSLKKLNVDYIDLLLMHWPVTGKYLDTWKEMEKLKDDGLCKSIGVCNCNIHHLEKIKKIARYLPVVNEIECHPLFTQDELRKYCIDNKIQVLAYTSTARMDERLKKTCLESLTKKYHKTIVQVVLRWHYQVGNIPIFNTTNLERYKDNLNIFDFNLSDDEVKAISAININSRLRYDPDNCDFTKL